MIKYISVSAIVDNRTNNWQCDLNLVRITVSLWSEHFFLPGAKNKENKNIQSKTQRKSTQQWAMDEYWIQILCVGEGCGMMICLLHWITLLCITLVLLDLYTPWCVMSSYFFTASCTVSVFSSETAGNCLNTVLWTISNKQGGCTLPITKHRG